MTFSVEIFHRKVTTNCKLDENCEIKVPHRRKTTQFRQILMMPAMNSTFSYSEMKITISFFTLRKQNQKKSLVTNQQNETVHSSLYYYWFRRF